jgi:hypothetical protein
MHRLIRCHPAAHQPIVDDGNHDDPATDPDQPRKKAGGHPANCEMLACRALVEHEARKCPGSAGIRSCKKLTMSFASDYRVTGQSLQTTEAPTIALRPG